MFVIEILLKLYWLLVTTSFFTIALHHFQLAWAPGKGMKDKQWKEYWEVDLGVSYIPIDKLDPQVDMAALEEVTTVMCNTVCPKVPFNFDMPGICLIC